MTAESTGRTSVSGTTAKALPHKLGLSVCRRLILTFFRCILSHLEFMSMHIQLFGLFVVLTLKTGNRGIQQLTIFS